MTGLHASVLRTTVAIAFALSATVASAQNFVSVDRNEINMRSGPGTQHSALWTLPRGYPLQTIERRGDWLKVRDFENDEGWVFRSLMGKKGHFVVKSKTANIRNGPGTQHRKVGEASYGEVVQTLERRKDWVQISQDGGTKGWIARRLLWGW